jgi:hypothetical protein
MVYCRWGKAKYTYIPKEKKKQENERKKKWERIKACKYAQRE